MDNFIFSINATLPIFLTMVLGLVFRKIGVFDDAFTNRMNSFVFKFALPALLFEDLWEENFYQAWNGGFVLFCFCATLGCIIVSTALSSFLKINLTVVSLFRVLTAAVQLFLASPSSLTFMGNLAWHHL